MSTENVEIVRRVFEAAARHDTEAVLTAYDAKVELEARAELGRLIGAGVYRGHEGVRLFFRRYYDA